jgi:hypothetical protein
VTKELRQRASQISSEIDGTVAYLHGPARKNGQERVLDRCE